MSSGNQTARELPLYRCHKVVRALKIKAIEVMWGSGGFAELCPEDQRYGPIRVSPEYIEKHRPHVGGYYVVYKDGYESFSPAEAFEEGYVRI